MRRRLAEPPPAKLQLLVGPRQVGKTTLLLEIARTAKRPVIYVNADTPEASLPTWADAMWREEPWEVDGVSTGSWGQWLVEVKSGPFGHSDLRGLAQAAQKFPAFKPVVLCDPGREDIAQAAGFTAKSWPAFLLTGLGC